MSWLCREHLCQWVGMRVGAQSGQIPVDADLLPPYGHPSERRVNPALYAAPWQTTLVLSCLFVLGGVACAQDALRTAVEGDRSYRQRKTPLVPRDDRLRAGPVDFSVGVGYGLEWSDNVQLQSEDPQSDFIHSVHMDVGGVWRAKQASVLTFGVGVGYFKYMDRSDLDRLIVSPDSEIAWDLEFKDLRVTIYDRCDYSEDVVSESALSGVASFARLDNVAGVRARWSPEHLRVEGGYAHQNYVAESDTFDYLTRASEQVFGRLGLELAEKMSAGAEATASVTDYDDKERSDNLSVSLGPFVEWQVQQDLTVRLRGGYVYYTFDESSVGTKSPDLRDYYVGIGGQHRLTEFIMHEIDVQREVRQGVNRGSDTLALWSARYTLNWMFHTHARVFAHLQFEDGEESLYGVPENYQRSGGGLGVAVEPWRRLSVSVGWRLMTKDSDSEFRDYDLMLVSLNAGYRW